MMASVEVSTKYGGT